LCCGCGGVVVVVVVVDVIVVDFIGAKEITMNVRQYNKSGR
jgi:hypothetical protein